MKTNQGEQLAAFRYKVYGLVIEAKGLLPGLRYADPGAVVDVRIHILSDEPWTTAPIPAQVWEASSENARTRFIAHHEFDIWEVECEEGRYYRIDPKNEQKKRWRLIINPGATAIYGFCRSEDFCTAEIFFTAVAKRCLGWVLRLRGVTCLHATVMIVEGRTIALVGKSGAGKSTTAAAMLDRGYPLLTDDVAALREVGSNFLVNPGFPMLPLLPVTIDHFFPSTVGFRSVSGNPLQDEEKFYVDLKLDGASASHGLDWRFHSRPATLDAIFLLDDYVENGVEPFIEDVRLAEGLFNLAANTYVVYLLDRDGRAREFELLKRIAASIPIRRLRRPHGLAHLPQVVDLMVADVRELTTRS